MAELNSGDFQVDHTLEFDNNQYCIETRSSFAYKTWSPETVITRAFSIIGPYQTGYKQGEKVKDFYAFAFYFLDPGKIQYQIEKNDLKIFFAGGATKEMMTDDKVSKYSNLRSGKAQYRIIYPITKGLDADKFFYEINLICR